MSLLDIWAKRNKEQFKETIEERTANFEKSIVGKMLNEIHKKSQKYNSIVLFENLYTQNNYYKDFWKDYLNILFERKQDAFPFTLHKFEHKDYELTEEQNKIINNFKKLTYVKTLKEINNFIKTLNPFEEELKSIIDNKLIPYINNLITNDR